MLEVFLIILALIWLIFAVISDLKTREIPNWLNFSLIIFALGVRFFYSVFNDNWSFFVQGVFGFAVFFAIANLLYFSRFFAGGDAKLMMALGPIIPFGTSFLPNVNLSISFLFLFLMTGAVFGLIAILYLSFKDFNAIKGGFIRNVKTNKKTFYMFMIIGLIFMFLGFFERLLFSLGILIFVMPYLYFYTKAIDRNMIVQMKTKNLTEGDWLNNDIKAGKNVIKANWQGLSKKEISLIRRKHKFVKIKIGIQYSPVFLMSFLAFVYFYLNGIDLWNSLWQP